MIRTKYGRFYWVAWQCSLDGSNIYCKSKDGTQATRKLSEAYLFTAEPKWLAKNQNWKTFKVMARKR